MTVSERTRHELYEAARHTFGDAAAETLMEMLPPIGWADVATKQDLIASEDKTGARISSVEERLNLRIDGVEERLNLRIDGVEERFTERLAATEARIEATLHREIAGIANAIARQTRTLMFSLVGMLVGIGSLSLGVAAVS